MWLWSGIAKFCYLFFILRSFNHDITELFYIQFRIDVQNGFLNQLIAVVAYRVNILMVDFFP